MYVPVPPVGVDPVSAVGVVFVQILWLAEMVLFAKAGCTVMVAELPEVLQPYLSVTVKL